MLYLFTGNNRYLIQQEAQKWKRAFGDKYGVENVTHITSIEEVSGSFIVESMISRSLFSEKRLVLIDGFPYSGERAFSGAADIEKNILASLEKIPQENIVVFLSENPDKRKTGYKKIVKLAEVKQFSTSGEDEVYQILSGKYGKIIDTRALQRLIFIKGGNLQKSISEIEKLSITINPSLTLDSATSIDKGIENRKISLEDINTIIIPEFEESIFVFIDTLLTKKKEKIFSEFQNLLDFSNMYALYQSILANLRTFLYIEFLKYQKISPHKIGDVLKLGNRQFLINKRHASSYKDIKTLYINLLDFDKNMKFGKFISSDENDMKKELERVFLKFVG